MINHVGRSQLQPPWAAALLAAEQALVRPYAVYSGIQVAACLLLRGGDTCIGVNYESASYGLTLCAERAAIARAQTEGRAADITGIVLVARQAGNGEGLALTPCGACRQWLGELCERLGQDLPLLSFAAGSSDGACFNCLELLPNAFGLPAAAAPFAPIHRPV